MKQIERLSFKQSKHLIERTGLGPELELIEPLIGKSLDFAIDSILKMSVSHGVQVPKLLKPSELQKTKKEFIKNGQRQKVNQLYRQERDILQAWGLKSLLESPNPLHERMVWFWHNHFTSSIQSVRITDWMRQQDSFIRDHALGSFDDFLNGMTFDPAMLIYLDGKSNKKGQPNENFARELLELFTLGEGNYTEIDVKEAARAFTGWNVNNKKNKVVFRKKFHDSGIKTFMGKQGNFDAKDILKILLENPRTAEFISEKFWHEFVSINPAEPEVIKAWAKSFRATNYDLSELLKTVFESDAFWDEKYRGTLIKSPIDLVVGTLRTLEFEDTGSSNKVFIKQLKQMGQELYSPPNVKGWEGGKSWINDDSLLRRKRFLNRILRGQIGANKQSNMQASGMTKTSKKNSSYVLPELSEEQWVEWLLPISAITPIKRKSKQARLKAILLDPAYQLK